MKHRVLQLLAFGAILALAAGSGLGARRAGGAQAGPGPAVPAAVQTFRLQGAGSCASSSCHNAAGPPWVRGSEYTTWLSNDLHARAFTVLQDERSQRIQENLNRSLPPNQRVLAENNPVCLRCHALDPAQLPPGGHDQLADGVSCENCHGPSGLWRTQHYLAGWRLLSVEQKKQLGFNDTKDLTERARACAQCHVGAGNRDVNHDLIAAGHPRLNFELGLYNARMPKHWNPRDDRARYPDFEARAWLVGQVVTAEAALELLADRAGQARENSRPWPEFAEYACFACHHDLKEPSPRQRLGYAGRVPGAFPWGTWYYSMLPAGGADLCSPDLAGPGTALGRLSATMSGPSPDPARVVGEARAAVRELEGVLQQLRTQRPDEGRVDRLLRTVARRDAERPPTSWDEAAQEYLALGALYNGLTDLDPRRRDAALRDGIQALTPPLVPPPGYSSPETFDVAAFKKQMEWLRNHLAGR